MDDLQREVFESAKAHDGLYLLSRRHGGPDIPPSELDRKYAAADQLVREGYAHWLSGHNHLAPGIRLTGKPVTETEAGDYVFDKPTAIGY